MSSALTFAVFAMVSAATQNDGLLVAQAFTSLSLISLLTSPLNQLVQAMPQLLACSACFGRIEEFLGQPEKDGMAEPGCERLLDDLDMHPHEILEKGSQDEKVHVGASTCAVSICDASFAWSPSADPVLHNISLEIPIHSIEVLCGTVGSGKSTLIQVILGNAMRVSGKLHVLPDSWSYCGQTSWLISGTIQENITAGSTFDDEWYKYTLWTCSLDHDVQQLLAGDHTQVGSNGTALSGGQKQRIVRLTFYAKLG